MAPWSPDPEDLVGLDQVVVDLTVPALLQLLAAVVAAAELLVLYAVLRRLSARSTYPKQSIVELVPHFAHRFAGPTSTRPYSDLD